MSNAAEPREEAWVIEPVGLGFTSRAREFWQYRKLLWFLARKASTERYQGTTLGIFWLFARPLLPLIISTFIFGSLLKAPSDGLPYFLFFLAGSSIWHFFERALLFVTRSLERARALVKKMYFPRLIAPVSSVMPALTDLGVYLGLLLGTAVYYLWKDGRWYLSIGPGFLVACGAVVIAFVLAIALGLFTAVWQVRHREVRFTIRYVMRFWFYLTPVIYPMSQVPPNLHWVIYLNPMASVVETFKWGLLGVGQLPVVPLLATLVIVPVLLAAGIWYFSRSETASVDEM